MFHIGSAFKADEKVSASGKAGGRWLWYAI
jgi:hypothetical protein